MITTYQNILNIKEGFIFHQVNCKGVMGAGIAAALAKQFPGLEKAYREFIRDELRRFGFKSVYDEDPVTGMAVSRNLLGRVFIYRPDPSKDLWIVNIFGQHDTSTTRRMTSYDATVEAFEAFEKEAAVSLPDMTCYFPFKMGCGLGGGNWQIYSAIIKAFFPEAIICKHNA